ncbi:MAG TPA: hypothetical protein VHD37_02405 [Candidatus Paceibacterota bacterium]|nr:hypothetical protein [Candidatus Paceibacterota bacterium]
MTQQPSALARGWHRYLDRIEWGKEAEDRFFAICSQKKSEGKFPPWLTDIRKANPAEDARGIDAWACTADAYDFKIDIKVSATAAKRTRERWQRSEKLRRRWKREKRYLILMFVVSPQATDEQVWNGFLGLLAEKRRERLAGFIARKTPAMN